MAIGLRFRLNTNRSTGGECSLVQTYLTWAQQETSPSVEFAVRGSPAANELVSRLPTITALLLSDNYRVSQGEGRRHM